jgi:hypothetical protein
VLAAALVFVVVSVAAPSSARSASVCSPSWQAVPDALPESWGIAGQSPTNAWAIGGHSLEHWDGQSWSLSWRPRVGFLAFEAIAAVGPSAAWVVGERETAQHPLTEHQWIGSWDGTRWHADHIPTLHGQTWLSDVLAVSPTDAWAVGGRWVHARTPHGIRTLIEHWNGRSWKVVSSAKIGHPTRFVATPKSSWLNREKIPASGDQLNAIAAVAPDNIWAVGAFDVLLNQHKAKNVGEYVSRLLTEHWNGKKWTVASTRPADPGGSFQINSPLAGEDLFTTLAAAPSGDVVGLDDWNIFSFRPVWWFNGSTWRHDLSLGSYQPTAVTITSHQDAWVMGDNTRPSSNPVPAAHWNGNQWLPTELPARGSVNAAAASGPDDVWVAGSLKPTAGSGSPNEMLHYTC